MAIEDEIRIEAENLDLRRLLAQAGIDAAEHLASDKLQRLLLEEVHHRVKNMMATVMAITSQSLRSADTLEHGREAVEARLLALGRAQDLLLQINWTSTRLAEVIASAIEPFGNDQTGRFHVNVPSIEVKGAAILPLALILNELITNAIKYGALSTPAGRVEIAAIVDDASGRFRLTWSEHGGPPVSAPTRRSFGSKLIERGLTRPLDGDATLDFLQDGVVCTINLPLTSVLS